MARESALRQRFMLLLKEAGFFAQAIESSTNPGMPDVWYAEDANRHQGWVECKSVKVLPKKADTSLFASLNHPLSSEQENFFARLLAKSVTCAILVAYERRYFLVPGKFYQQFNSFTFERLTMFEVKKAELIHMLRVNHAKQLSNNSGGA